MGKRSTGEQLNILMIEREPTCVRFVGELLKEHQLKHCLHTVSDELEAINYLRKDAPYQKVPTPQLTLLNASSSGLSFQSFAELHTESVQRQITLVILESSDAENEYVRRNFAALEFCINRPIDRNKLSRIAATIQLSSLIVLHTRPKL